MKLDNKLLQMKIIVSVAFLFSIIVSCTQSTDQIWSENLKCEYLVNPIGIDSENPRFSWQMKAERPGASQKAYEIFIGTDSSEVASCKGNIWVSGKVVSDRVPVVYHGSKLTPFTRYFWGVKVQDENSLWSELSPVSSFETGMMEEGNWKGSWITDGQPKRDKPGVPDAIPSGAPYYRKSFEMNKKIKSARAYIAVAGLYEFYINGERIGDHRLDPMFTRFDRRTLYVTYDVTKNLQNGENVIGVLLGNGWYNLQSRAVWFFDKAPWRARPKFCLDLRITYDDETTETISTGSDWKSSHSPIIFNSIYTGEHYDARLEQNNWNDTGFDDSKWETPRFILTWAPSQNIVAQQLHPIRNVKRLTAKKMIQLNDRTYVFDFGRNFSGISQLNISGEVGTVVRLKHGEILDKQGHVDLSNIDVHYRPLDKTDPFQTDIFILCGKGEETFMPRFNYKGFQYVEVTANKPVKLTKESLTAYFMHSDVPQVGSIRSSNPLLDKIWQASNATYLSNLFGYPTDCPHREKNGWVGDARINTETGLYNFDAVTIYEKWMADFRDAQQPNGLIPAIIPSSGWGENRGFFATDWTSAVAVIPWNVYLFYGDTRILEDNYENIKRYVEIINEKNPSGLNKGSYGDWLPVKSVSSRELLSSTYFFVTVTILSKTAKILGKPDDYEKYSALAKRIKDAINKKYLDAETGIYGSGFQTELSFALYWGLVPEELIPKVAQNLAERVRADNSHVDVGLLGSKTILNALSENGYADLAYTVATQETYPSWGWWIVNGATTFYEKWTLDDQKNDGSRNHPGFGEINAWFYKGLGGIFPDESQPGFKNIILKPNFVSGLEQFEASHEGPYGNILSSWEKSGEVILYEVSIPANSTATLFLSAKSILESGKDLSENKHIRTEKGGNQSLRIYLEAGNYIFSVNE